MKNKAFPMMLFIEELVDLGERQGETEEQAAKKIIQVLQERDVSYLLQEFETYIPKYKKAELYADGKNIPVKPTSFVSGEIKNKNAIISSLISSQRFIDETNINFNPCSRTFSRSNHYFAPSVAVQPKDLEKICNAKEVKGEVIIEKQKHRSKNILVGNTENPKTILFCHYDSIGPGAVDNASGTAVLLSLLLRYPKTRTENLYVIAGNEELSYDKPLYWGFGYRIFEEKYEALLHGAQQILCVDCVGNGPPLFNQSLKLVRLGLPLRGLKVLLQKTYAVYGDFEKLMEIYHGEDDTLDKIQEKFLEETIQKIYKKLSNL